MGGRGSGSAMSTGGGSAAVRNVFGMSASKAAGNYWNDLRIPPSEKYAQVERAANGQTLGYHQYDVIRTQAAKNNPDLFKNGGWEPGYQKALEGKLGESGQNALQSAIQSEAKKWLKKNPRPAHPRKDGYKWNGTKYVKS